MMDEEGYYGEGVRHETIVSMAVKRCSAMGNSVPYGQSSARLRLR